MENRHNVSEHDHGIQNILRHISIRGAVDKAVAEEIDTEKEINGANPATSAA